MAHATFVQFPTFVDNNGVLCVYEEGALPFALKRVFTVTAKYGDVRGDHAHKECSQLLVCVSGQIRVTCDDGSVVEEYVCGSGEEGLLIPPGIWARQEYLGDNVVLMVFCDRVYEEEDYIRDYNDFKSFVGQ